MEHGAYLDNIDNQAAAGQAAHLHLHCDAGKHDKLVFVRLLMAAFMLYSRAAEYEGPLQDEQVKLEDRLPVDIVDPLVRAWWANDKTNLQQSFVVSWYSLSHEKKITF